MKINGKPNHKHPTFIGNARNVVSQLITLGTFPSVILQPLNFDVLYKEQQKAKQEKK